MDDTTTDSNGNQGGLDQLAAALAKCQSKVLAAIKDSVNPHLRNKYADLASVWDACRTHLGKEGLAVVQGGHYTPEGGWVLRTTLLHSSGQFIDRDFPMIYGAQKGINDMQALGQAISYSRRYGLSAMVGVVQEDDDGHGAGPSRQESQQQEPTPQTTTQFGPNYIAQSAQTAGSLIGRFNAALSLEEQHHIVGSITKEVTALLTPEDLQRVRQAHSACSKRLQQQLAAQPVASS